MEILLRLLVHSISANVNTFDLLTSGMSDGTKWVWATDNTPVQNIFWAPGEPKNDFDGVKPPPPAGTIIQLWKDEGYRFDDVPDWWQGQIVCEGNQI